MSSLLRWISLAPLWMVEGSLGGRVGIFCMPKKSSAYGEDDLMCQSMKKWSRLVKRERERGEACRAR